MERSDTKIVALKEALNPYLVQQANIIVAYLFGSVSRGQENQLSDIDIAILLDAQGLSEEQLLAAHLELTLGITACIGEKAQVVLLNRAAPFLAYNVIREGVLLYERTATERIAFVVRAMKLYFDFKPALEFHQHQLLERIEEHGLGYRKKRDNETIATAERLHQRLARSGER